MPLKSCLPYYSGLLYSTCIHCKHTCPVPAFCPKIRNLPLLKVTPPIKHLPHFPASCFIPSSSSAVLPCPCHVMSLPSLSSYPWLLLQLGHHDNVGRVLLPDHPPELPKSLRERSLSGDIGVLTAVAVDVVSVDVVTPWHTCVTRGKRWMLQSVEEENEKRYTHGEEGRWMLK